MEDKLQYSIIFADIRPEIEERLSLGVLVIENNKLSVRYSENKLQILKQLYTTKEYKVITSLIRNDLSKLTSVEVLTYLIRYSNNLITFSPIKSIDNTHTNIDSDWLFKKYVDDTTRV